MPDAPLPAIPGPSTRAGVIAHLLPLSLREGN